MVKASLPRVRGHLPPELAAKLAAVAELRRERRRGRLGSVGKLRRFVFKKGEFTKRDVLGDLFFFVVF